jgi:REP element-mobilizing transposase RayT
MPRPPRPQFPGGVYHVTARGVRGLPIAVDDDDRLVFLRFLDAAVARFHWICTAYCLMTNHFHLLVETPDGDLARGMQLLNSRLAQAFNRRHGVKGHLFERRYHAVVVADDAQLLEAARYVVLNPVRANVCSSPERWRWSSYRASAGLVSAPRFLALRALWPLFGPADRAALSYRRFVDAARLR